MLEMDFFLPSLLKLRICSLPEMLLRFDFRSKRVGWTHECVEAKAKALDFEIRWAGDCLPKFATLLIF